jgi:hypothetical protein
MVRYRRKLLLKSAVITILVFFTGILLGISLDNLRENEVLTDLKFNELDTQSYFLEERFIKESGKDVCEILNSRIDNLRYRLVRIGSELPSSEESSISKNADLDYLKRKYTISEVQFLMLLNDLNENCDDSYIPILFFYTKDEAQSRDQGYVLTWANEKYKENIVILSFDTDYFDEPLINTLKLHYNIKSKSAVVINEKTYSEFISKEELDKILIRP